MTTNLKTAIRTGGLPTQGGPPAGGSFFGGLLEKFKSFTPKQKVIGAAVVIGIISVILLANLAIKASAYVPIYGEISPSDLQAITFKLAELKIPYELGSNGRTVLVPPSKANRAKVQLAYFGLPHTPVNKIEDKKEGLTPKTQSELDQESKARLEGELITAIREIEGVADCIVKITLPDNSLFKDDQNPPTAAVMLKLQPGAQVNPTQVAGIAHFVSSSVPGLSPQNVKIIDIQGRPYAVDNRYINKEAVSSFSPEEQEKVAAYENRLKDKINEVLSGVLDKDKYTVALSVEMDPSQSEITEEKYGGPTNVSGSVTSVEKVTEEEFSSMPEADKASQMGGISEVTKKGQGEYSKKTRDSAALVDSVKKRTITAPGTVKRISASVAVDNLQQSDVKNIEKLVANAINLNYERGDQLAVVSMPFSQDVFEAMKNEITRNPVPVTRGAIPAANSALLLVLALTPMMILIIIAAYFLLRQRNAVPQIRFNNQLSSSVTQIDAGGQFASDAAKASTTAFKLEMLAKKPTRVAELLKSTWLADKER